MKRILILASLLAATNVWAVSDRPIGIFSGWPFSAPSIPDKNAVNPKSPGDIVFDSTAVGFFGWDGASWVNFGGSSAPTQWVQNGGAIYYQSGQVGIGAPPTASNSGIGLHVYGTEGGDALIIRSATSGPSAGIAFRSEYPLTASTMQGINADLNGATTIAINPDGGDLLFGAANAAIVPLVPSSINLGLASNRFKAVYVDRLYDTGNSSGGAGQVPTAVGDGSWAWATTSGAGVAYAAGSPGDWAGAAPATVAQALDRLAALAKALNGGNPVP